jgi:hypothetical protein
MSLGRCGEQPDGTLRREELSPCRNSSVLSARDGKSRPDNRSVASTIDGGAIIICADICSSEDFAQKFMDRTIVERR